jgi:DNA repair protein RecO (recombination protein O)
MLQKTKGIALHYIKYGDSSIIAYIYTDIFGRQAYIVNGVRSKKSKIRLSLFQPLSVLELDVYYKPNREIQRIKDLRNYLPLQTIHSDMVKSSIAIFISEIIYKSLREIEPNKPLFDFLYHSIHLLDTKTEGIENYHLVFLLVLSKYLGISPQMTDKGKSSKIDGGNYVVLNDNLQYTFLLSDEEVGGMDELYKYSFEGLEKIKINNNTRSSLLDKLVEYYQIHLEGMGSIKSLAVLKEVFSI